jgi:hypothetical protein
VPIDDAEQLLCFIALGDVEELYRCIHTDDRCSALRHMPGDSSLAPGRLTDAQTLDVADRIEQGREHEIVDEGTCVDAVDIPHQ